MTAASAWSISGSPALRATWRRPARATLDVVRTLERLGDSGRRGAFLKTVRAVIDGRGQKVLALDRLDLADRIDERLELVDMVPQVG